MMRQEQDIYIVATLLRAQVLCIYTTVVYFVVFAMRDKHVMLAKEIGVSCLTLACLQDKPYII